MIEESFPFAPKTAIERWQKQELDGTALMRCLVAYQRWMVPVSEAAVGEMLLHGGTSSVMFSKDPQGVSRLLIFSDSDAYGQLSEAAGVTSEQHFLTTRGIWVFRLPLDEIDFIAINPSSPHEIAYGKNLFPRLRQMANAIEVEDALRDLRAGSGTTETLLPLVQDYQAYVVAVRKTAQGLQMAMAPDAGGRTLAAVFTSEEAFDAYVPESNWPQGDGQLLLMTLTGTELFGQLLKMKLDGIVFNCNGPPQPIAFALQFAQVVLDSKPGA